MIKVRSIHVYNDEKIYYFIQDEEKACFYSDDEVESVIDPSMNREEMEKAVGDFLNKKGVKIKDNCSINNLYPPLAYVYSTMILSEQPEKESRRADHPPAGRRAG